MSLCVLDGGFATHLECLGAVLGDDPLWSGKIVVENPELIIKAHRDYLDAGAAVLITASYQLSIEGLQERGLSRAEAIQRIASTVELAFRAIDEFCSSGAAAPRPNFEVWGSLGCYGAYLRFGQEYSGTYVEEAGVRERIISYHMDRARALLSLARKPDALLLETVPALSEAVWVAEVFEREWPSVRLRISFSTADGVHTRYGDRLADCAAALSRFANVDLLGVNCSPPQVIDDALAALAGFPRIMVYPNSGEEWDGKNFQWKKTAYSLTPATFAEKAAKWRQLGATHVGGCCRIGPAFIGALAAHNGNIEN